MSDGLIANGYIGCLTDWDPPGTVPPLVRLTDYFPRAMTESDHGPGAAEFASSRPGRRTVTIVVWPHREMKV